MINSCSFIGTCGSDPEIRTMTDGTKVANFSIACNENWKDKDGNKQEKTEWIRLVAWRKLAEIIERYVKKGQQVYVEGKQETRQYDKDGVTHYATTINLNTLKMLGGKKDGPEQGPTAPSEPTGLKEKSDWSANPEPTNTSIPGEDDLPF